MLQADLAASVGINPGMQSVFQSQCRLSCCRAHSMRQGLHRMCWEAPPLNVSNHIKLACARVVCCSNVVRERTKHHCARPKRMVSRARHGMWMSHRTLLLLEGAQRGTACVSASL